jgi:hypothetical protein
VFETGSVLIGPLLSGSGHEPVPDDSRAVGPIRVPVYDQA